MHEAKSLVDMARALTIPAIQTLEAIMLDPKAPHGASLIKVCSATPG